MSRRMGLPSLSTETISYWTPPWGGPSARICKRNKASSASLLSHPPGDYLLWPRAGPFTEDNSPHPTPTCYFEPELASGKVEVLLSSNSPASSKRDPFPSGLSLPGLGFLMVGSFVCAYAPLGTILNIPMWLLWRVSTYIYSMVWRVCV